MDTMLFEYLSENQTASMVQLLCSLA